MQVDLFGACFRAPHLTCSVSPAADINPVGFYLDVKVHLIEPYPDRSVIVLPDVLPARHMHGLGEYHLMICDSDG